ncbi:MAG: sodium/solute symporter [Sedimentisphaerales bacterium]|nr:sodium/solute symporter [Sedimentisphaerales bacterium]
MKQTMQPLDWVVIGVYGLGMLAIGWYFSRRTKTSEDYMLGGRQMRFWMVGLSLFASLFSAASYLATPGEIIKYGPMIRCGIAAHPFTYLVVGWLLIPAFMKLKISSAYELLEVRLGPSLRVLASILFLILRLFWMSLIIYICAVKVIVPIMGWSQEAALWVSIAMGVVTVIYTSVGGLRAVVLTDVIQSFILFSAAIVSMILIGKMLGGVGTWFSQDWPQTWVEWKFFDANARASFLTAVLSSFCWYVFTAGSDQMAIQRYLATRDVKSARRALLTTLIFDALVGIILVGLGFALFAYYQASPELVPAGETMRDADSLFPRFIVTVLPTGITGLAIAGLLAAAMSSLSSGVNSSCLAISADFIGRFGKRQLSESAQVKLAKVISFAIGVIVVVLSLMVGKVKGNLMALCYKIANLLVAPLFVPFFMAVFVRRATEVGTFIGTIVSIIVAVLVAFSGELFDINITFLWIMPISFATGVVVSFLISLIFPRGNNKQKAV